MKHFTMQEFACKCGCKRSEMDEFFLERLDLARDVAGVPFRLTSAYRCEKHNKAVGGVENSAHTKGLAVDILCKNGVQRQKIVWSLLSVGFKRIGIAKDFIHVDADEEKQNSLWLY